MNKDLGSEAFWVEEGPTFFFLRVSGRMWFLEDLLAARAGWWFLKTPLE